VIATVIAALNVPSGTDPGTSSQQCSDVATSASGKTERDLVYTRNGLTDGQHTIEVTATTDAPVVLDGFVLLT
jgi:hypothetical protein